MHLERKDSLTENKYTKERSHYLADRNVTYGTAEPAPGRANSDSEGIKKGMAVIRKRQTVVTH